MAKRASEKQIPVVVTTVHKGVFFGYSPCLTLDDSKMFRLSNARMCVYYSEDMHSVMGLAAQGPSRHCKISPAVPFLLLTDVTAVLEATEAAAPKWEAAPWS